MSEEKKYDIDTIISVEEFEKNRQEHLKKDAQRRKKQKKEKIKSILGVTIFYLIIVVGVIAINARMEDLNQQKSANEPVIQIAQNQ